MRKPRVRFARRFGAAIAGIGIGVVLDGLGAFDGSPSIVSTIVGAALIAIGVAGFVWAVKR